MPLEFEWLRWKASHAFYVIDKNIVPIMFKNYVKYNCITDLKLPSYLKKPVVLVSYLHVLRCLK